MRGKTMSATITLPAELEEMLTRKAAAEGVEMEQFAVNALRRVAELPSIRELFADVQAEFEASGMTDEELAQEIEAAVAEVRARRRG
jgi:ribosome-binding protein aMBF1 (putative translation factor)